MAARAGMANLLLELRQMTETAAADYSVNAVSYWTDDQLQAITDQYVDIHRSQELLGDYEYLNSTTEWHDYPLGATNIEEVASGWPYWSLVDTSAVTVSSSLYTLDPLAGLVHFAANTKGFVYFCTFRSYRLEAAAADIWRKKAAHVASMYNFTAEGQSFSRAQYYDHCMQMAEFYAKQTGITTLPMYRSDLL